jgi:hypothetical protein
MVPLRSPANMLAQSSNVIETLLPPENYSSASSTSYLSFAVAARLASSAPYTSCMYLLNSVVILQISSKWSCSSSGLSSSSLSSFVKNWYRVRDTAVWKAIQETVWQVSQMWQWMMQSLTPDPGLLLYPPETSPLHLTSPAVLLLGGDVGRYLTRMLKSTEEEHNHGQGAYSHLFAALAMPLYLP